MNIMNNLVLLNLDTNVNGLHLAQGSDTNFTCTINTPGCTKVSSLTNEGGAKLGFSNTADSKTILDDAMKGGES